MTAAVRDKENTRRYGAVGDGYQFDLPLTASAEAFGGTIAVLDSGGNVKPGVTGTGLKTLGVFDRHVLNTAVAGAKKATVKPGVWGPFANSGSIVAADRLALCYVVDDQTVARTDGTGTRSVAGLVMDVTSEGVYVALGVTFIP